ncbi:T9SS type A sorting domain-containing protein [Fulvivirga maritima]|uniref:leucine-rich repeat domain-containing protein n=1 Tax=Fulvivirga maritima TaxID=2904247 RepID=UPI001F406948|nr:leucine-rich repeat domain-containing protein [Fulvivirga maritima]UII27514.1 T9SS type A sorting domain-containing protein [Fulvivirga maritima]
MVKYFLTLCFCGLFLKAAEAQTPAYKPDSLVLLNFHQQMMDSGWPAFWNTTKNVREWTGVSYDYNSGKVYGVTLSGDWFNPHFTTDSLPAAIQVLSAMDSLVSLGVSHFNLKYLPEEMTDLEDLKSLSLGYNSIETLPDFINELEQLEILLLGNNEFADLPDLSDLINLKVLSLSQNIHLEQFPASILELESLIDLRLSYNSITGLPSSIDELQQLQKLYLQANGLISLPESVGNLSNLDQLVLSNNQLTDLPSSINNLTKLERLDVNRNQLSALPADMSNLTNLIQIDISENKLTEFPESIVGLRGLRQITANKNQMEGEIPEDVFRINRLRLDVSDNNLSGELEVIDNNITERLLITNNRYTFRDIINFYGQFNPSYIEFQPQQYIGTYRTLEPRAGEVLDVFIDNYIPASGNTYQWYRADNIALTGATKYSTEDSIHISSYDASAHAGIYYCIIKNPSLPNLSLRSNVVRVLGNDNAPELTYQDLIFREGGRAYLNIAAKDDFTPINELEFRFPEETEHFILKPDTLYSRSYAKFVLPKTVNGYGKDTLTVEVEDEGGNVAIAQLTIEMLSDENANPEVSMDTIYMNLAQDAEPPCTPGTTGCNAFYYFTSITYLKYFVTDDFTDYDRLTYRVLEADSLNGEVIPGKVYVQPIIRPDGITLDANVLANQDTSVTITLQVMDPEGGVIQKSVTLMGEINPPNRNPEIEDITDQLISRGARSFSTLNLSEYSSDDYLSNNLLTWQISRSNVLKVNLSDSLLEVQPMYEDSSYTAQLEVYVYEKTNYNRSSSTTVNYIIKEGIAISGMITDVADQPLENVELQGFDEPVFTSAAGYYEAHVLEGWSGEVIPVKEDYLFSPESQEYNNLQSSLQDQDYQAEYIGSYTISGVISTAESGLGEVLINGFTNEIYTDDVGYYSVEVPYDWNGTLTPELDGFSFEPTSRTYEQLTANLSNEDYQAYHITGVEGRDAVQLLTVYPNPSSTSVTFMLSDAHFNDGIIEVYNTHGKKCGTIKVETDTSRYEWKGAEQTPAGIYYAKLTVNGKAESVLKFIVE